MVRFRNQLYIYHWIQDGGCQSNTIQQEQTVENLNTNVYENIFYIVFAILVIISFCFLFRKDLLEKEYYDYNDKEM